MFIRRYRTMFEIFTTAGSFSAYIITLGIMAILSIVFENRLVAMEDRFFEWLHSKRGGAKK